VYRIKTNGCVIKTNHSKNLVFILYVLTPVDAPDTRIIWWKHYPSWVNQACRNERSWVTDGEYRLLGSEPTWCHLPGPYLTCNWIETYGDFFSDILECRFFLVYE